MDPFFTEEQLNNMSRENMMEVMRIMQNQIQKKETEVQLLKDKQKELEFMNAMLSDRLALAQRRRFGSSSEKYADGYEQMDLFNEAEVNADMDTAEIEEEIVIPSHKRKKRTGKKEEDLSNFEVTETIEYKLTGEDRYCPDCGTNSIPRLRSYFSCPLDFWLMYYFKHNDSYYKSFQSFGFRLL